ncbi:MAG TPA: hypothetical protein DD001_17560 [Microcoleaceae bacterium UBA10368]|jgi:hypothetical protein|nr:hypothetical protein [Microcoleaceae cyanobacterium UBA10368]
MKSLKSNLMILASVGLLFLGACSKGDQASDPNSSPTSPPVASQPASSAPNAAPGTADKTVNSKASKGGQVVESGAYHLEFLAAKEATGTHLDFYLQKGDKREPVPNAKVTAQVQLPNGKQQTLALKYDADGKHYAVVFPGQEAGQYPVKVTADINGEKVNGRFTFNQ